VLLEAEVNVGKENLDRSSIYAEGMTGLPVLRTEVDGRAASVEQLRHIALNAYGHFTAMQVRNGRVRGLAQHLARLSAASLEMFGVDHGGDLIRAYIRHALGDDITDGSVRTIVFAAADDTPSVLVTVRPPGGMPSGPQSLHSVPYQRPLPHLKQIGGGFGQTYYRRVAERNGYTEALLTGPDGVIAEGAITNVGCYDGESVVWPDAPNLAGITMQLLEAHLAEGGLTSRRAEVRLADLPSFDAVFVASSRGVGPVDRVDELAIPVDPNFMRTVSDVYESVPWDVI
jgi:branched-subunit amino acid aminotransferase/4-amino-4-deoxychorismate lyase